MALSACMWTGVSGLLAHGEKMNVIGNNIANVSTVGFKGQRMDFADFVYQNTFSSQGMAQIGRGVKIGAIMGNFQTGPYETTTESTDLAISGRGFFKVNKIGSDQAYFTRAGNFRFNVDGYLVDPNGLAVQGWKVNNNGGVEQAAGGMSVDSIDDKKQSDIIGAGVPTDIRLNTWTVLPQQTTKVSMVQLNLPPDGADRSRDDTNPFASLFQVWNGTQPPATPTTLPIAETNAAFQTTLEVYDEGGTKHKVTVYFDKVSETDTNSDGSIKVWEYIVTMDPAEDQRMFNDGGTMRKVNETEAGGLLMTGTLAFNSAGSLVNQSSYTWGGTKNPTTNPQFFDDVKDPNDPMNTVKLINLNPTDMNNWYPAAISTNGLPMMVANFGGIIDAQTTGSETGFKYNIEMDFGLKVGNYTMPWENQNALGKVNVDPYAHNSNYKVNGPEYMRVNPNYDPTLDLVTEPNAYPYLFDIPGFPNEPYPATTTPGFAQAFREVLIQFYAANENLTIKKGAIDNDPLNLVPPQDFTMSLPPDGELVGTATYPGTLMDGTAWTLDLPTVIGAGAVLADIQDIADDLVDEKIRGGLVVDRSVWTAASPANYHGIAEINKPVVIDSTGVTSFGGAFSSTPAQNGYGFGDLSSWMVDQQGVLYGVYSNGVTLPLWQVTLYDFNCTQGLRREGQNLFSKTRESGEAKSGPAGVSGLGTISGSTLEQSNVDMSTEFVQMIQTQRGFQSNSKIITTTDIMLDTVINMKR